MRCLLNPNIKLASPISLDNSTIQLAQFNQQYTAVNDRIPSLSPTGSYKVLAVQHVGDTRGREWYTDIICSAIDGTQPLTGPALTSVAAGS